MCFLELIEQVLVYLIKPEVAPYGNYIATSN